MPSVTAKTWMGFYPPEHVLDADVATLYAWQHTVDAYPLWLQYDTARLDVSINV